MKRAERLPCGHPSTLMLLSAETGAPLYCELCDCLSARRDAEKMEAEYSALLRQALSTLKYHVQQTRPIAQTTDTIKALARFGPV